MFSAINLLRLVSYERVVTNQIMRGLQNDMMARDHFDNKKMCHPLLVVLVSDLVESTFEAKFRMHYVNMEECTLKSSGEID